MQAVYAITRSLRPIAMSKWSYRTAKIILAAVFIYAGAAKLAAPHDFARIIDAYGLLPPQLVGITALALPLAEVLAGVGLLLDLRASLSAIGAMTVLFMGVLGYGMALGLDIDCGCYAPGDPEANAFHGLQSAFIRDVGLMTLVIYAYWWRRAVGFSPHRLTTLTQQIIIQKRSTS